MHSLSNTADKDTILAVQDVITNVLSKITVNNGCLLDTKETNNITAVYDEDDDDDNIDVQINSFDITKTIAGSSSVIHSSPYSLSNLHNSQQSAHPRTIPSLQRTQNRLDIDSPGMINGINTFDYDLNQIRDEDKPWRKPGADITDYFNYGFNEESWTLYCMKQRRLRTDNLQINAALQKNPVINASGLIAQVFKSGKVPIVSNQTSSNSRRQPPTNIDVIGATDETSRRQGSLSSSQNVPDMSTPPPGYGSSPSVNLAPPISSAFNHISSQPRHAGSPQQNAQNIQSNSFLPAPTAIQLQQQFAAALAAVRFPPRGNQNVIHRMPSSSIPPRMQNIYQKMPDSHHSQDTVWENPNAPKRDHAPIADYPLDRVKKVSPSSSRRHHSNDRRSLSPRRRHRYHRYRGRSPVDRRHDTSPYHHSRRHHHGSRYRGHSPVSSHTLRRRDSSEGSDSTRKHSKKRYRDSRSTSITKSSKNRKRSRSLKSRSSSRRRISSRQKESRSRSRSRRKEDIVKEKS